MTGQLYLKIHKKFKITSKLKTLKKEYKISKYGLVFHCYQPPLLPKFQSLSSLKLFFVYSFTIAYCIFPNRNFSITMLLRQSFSSVLKSLIFVWLGGFVFVRISSLTKLSVLSQISVLPPSLLPLAFRHSHHFFSSKIEHSKRKTKHLYIRSDAKPKRLTRSRP